MTIVSIAIMKLTTLAGFLLSTPLQTLFMKKARSGKKLLRSLLPAKCRHLEKQQPSPEQRQTFIASLEAVLNQEAQENPNPGAPVLPRLNRTEYQNSIRDLLALDIDASSHAYL